MTALAATLRPEAALAEFGIGPASDEPPWPSPLDQAAFQGFAGRFVAAVAPYTEADPAALHFQLLSSASAAVGANVYAVAGDARHPARLWSLIVGATAKGRKDTSAQPARRLVRRADPGLAEARGLSSGEGLTWHVRDGRPARGKADADEGVTDKRLHVRESEFATVLRVAGREGNNLAGVLKEAWDDGNLRTLTKHDPTQATGAHIVVTGHIVVEELRRYMPTTELVSGLANRFLIVLARRAQVLPDGDQVPPDVLNPLAAELRDIIAWAETGPPRPIRRDAAAGAAWHAAYGRLSAGQPGLYGAATSRAEAQALRLSVLFAILDCSDVIRAEHVQAALATWAYADDSARWVFGTATGNPIADVILAGLRSSDLGRSQLYGLFGRHVTREQVDQALAELTRGGRIVSRQVPTAGRPAEVWHVVR